MNPETTKKTLSRQDVETVARVMADSFMEDPLNIAVLEGVSRKKELLLAHSLLHTRHAMRCGTLTLLEGDPRAFLIGLDSKYESRLKDIGLIMNVYAKTIRVLGFKDLRTIFANNNKVKKSVSFSWQKEFIKGRYFRVKIVAIDKALRGSGAFRRLITPHIEACDAGNIPMILETHNSNNLGIYERFGFELVKTLSSGTSPIRQYCMIRKPAPAAKGSGR